MYSFILANQSQIVLGTFSTISNAKKVEQSINKIIQKDEKFKNFLNKNSLKAVSKEFGKYFIVTIEPFNDIVTQYSVLNRLKKTKFKDAYVLQLTTQENSEIDIPKEIEIEETQIIDDPLLMPEPNIKSIKVEPLIQKKNTPVIDKIKKKKKDIVVKEKSTPKKNKELNVLETYLNEVIASLVILLLIIIYFIIKKSQKKRENDFEDSTLKPDKQDFYEKQIQENSLEEILDEDLDTNNQKQEPMIMQERQETINFTALTEGEGEEGSFATKQNNKIKEKSSIEEAPISNKLFRIKREVPPNLDIAKDNFKEFAGLKILVAEDNLINQKVINGLLADSGIEITLVDDGQFLLETLEKNSDFNFILMDVHMPRVDGFEASKRIRKNPKYNHIIIVALSGDTAPDDILKMTQAGMEEHLEKPLKMESLYNILYAYTQNDIEHKIPDEFIEVDITNNLNTDQGLQICGDDIDFYHEILSEFVNIYKDSPTELKELIDAGKIQNADRYLLDLSGITANIGAINISKTVLELKKAIVQPKDARCVELLKEYENSLNTLLEDIKNYKD
jgi:CheY-like chemotaxis protein